IDKKDILENLTPRKRAASRKTNSEISDGQLIQRTLKSFTTVVDQGNETADVLHRRETVGRVETDLPHALELTHFHHVAAHLYPPYNCSRLLKSCPLVNLSLIVFRQIGIGVFDHDSYGIIGVCIFHELGIQ